MNLQVFAGSERPISALSPCISIIPSYSIIFHYWMYFWISTRPCGLVIISRKWIQEWLYRWYHISHQLSVICERSFLLLRCSCWCLTIHTSRFLLDVSKDTLVETVPPVLQDKSDSLDLWCKSLLKLRYYPDQLRWVHGVKLQKSSLLRWLQEPGDQLTDPDGCCYPFPHPTTTRSAAAGWSSRSGEAALVTLLGRHKQCDQRPLPGCLCPQVGGGKHWT